MSSTNMMHFILIVPIILAIFLVPVARVLRRAGFSSVWCVLSVIPLVGLIGLWVFAFIPWPAIDQPATRGSA